MDYAEMLFALQMRAHVIAQMERRYPESMSASNRTNFIAEHFEELLLMTLDDIERTAYLIKDSRSD